MTVKGFVQPIHRSHMFAGLGSGEKYHVVTREQVERSSKMRARVACGRRGHVFVVNGATDYALATHVCKNCLEFTRVSR
jgi:hypothetical protein